MVLVARQTALAVLPEKNCFPFVCDLATADDLPAVLALDLSAPHASTSVTFFGMIPNFEPQIILPKLASLIRPQGFSAVQRESGSGQKLRRRGEENPAAIRQPAHPGLAADVPARSRGRTQATANCAFPVAAGALGLKRVVADFHFTRRCRIEVENERL